MLSHKATAPIDTAGCLTFDHLVILRHNTNLLRRLHIVKQYLKFVTGPDYFRHCGRTDRALKQGPQMRKSGVRSDWIGKRTHSIAQLLPHSGNAQTWRMQAVS